MKDIVLNSKSIWIDGSSSEWEPLYEAPNALHIYKFIYVKRGFITVYSKNREFKVNSGEAIFIPMDDPFRIILNEENGGTFVHRISYRYFPNVDHYDYKMQTFKLNQKIIEYIEELKEIRDLVNSEFIWKAYRLLDEFEKLMNKNQEIGALKIEKALDYMREHDRYTLPELAKMCNMSRSSFYDLFQKVVGCTPIQTKHRFQAHKAELLLKSTDMTVDEIAERVGFNSTPHFRKVFYSRYHCSPNDIRKKFKGQF